jgi:hypothetical protein
MFDQKLLSREIYCNERLTTLKSEIVKIEEVKNNSDFCIYVTGSFGRHEACAKSDLDLFFINKSKTGFSKISKTLIDASLINICRQHGFPDFSNDGEYLEIHDLPKMLDELGSKSDDYYNYFTARMLLLLESSPIYNEVLYSQIIHEIIDRYYKDFNDHHKDFLPVFLVNDIIRFWKTMCLNYEHKRNREFIGLDEQQKKDKKNKNRLKNLKLKFSRKSTCYSFLLSLMWAKGTLKQEDVFKVAQTTSLRRLLMLSEYNDIKNEVNEAIKLYFWFLDIVQQDEKDALQWIDIEKNRNEAFEKSKDFGQRIFNIMLQSPYKNNLIYLMI